MPSKNALKFLESLLKETRKQHICIRSIALNRRPLQNILHTTRITCKTLLSAMLATPIRHVGANKSAGYLYYNPLCIVMRQWYISMGKRFATYRCSCIFSPRGTHRFIACSEERLVQCTHMPLARGLHTLDVERMAFDFWFPWRAPHNHISSRSLLANFTRSGMRLDLGFTIERKYVSGRFVMRLDILFFEIKLICLHK